MLGRYLCREQNLPADVGFAEEEEGAQTLQTGWRRVNDRPQRRAAAATLEGTVDAAEGT